MTIGRASFGPAPTPWRRFGFVFVWRSRKEHRGSGEPMLARRSSLNLGPLAIHITRPRRSGFIFDLILYR